MILGAVPGAKVLHGCDESSEPEMFPVSARLVREALERVLGDLRRSRLPVGERRGVDRPAASWPTTFAGSTASEAES